MHSNCPFSALTWHIFLLPIFCLMAQPPTIEQPWCKSALSPAMQWPGGGALPAEVAADQVRHRPRVGRPPRGMGRDDQV